MIHVANPCRPGEPAAAPQSGPVPGMCGLLGTLGPSPTHTASGVLLTDDVQIANDSQVGGFHGE